MLIADAVNKRTKPAQPRKFPDNTSTLTPKEDFVILSQQAFVIPFPIHPRFCIMQP